MNAIDNKDYSVDELSALFDAIPTGANLDDKSDDYGVTTATSSVRPFDDLCKDIKAVMEHEQVQIEPKIQPESTKEKSKPEKKLVPKMANPVIKTPVEEHELEEEDGSEEIEVEKKIEKPSKDIDPNNPLELNETDLKAYNEIKAAHPQFILYDGSYSFRDFYRFKVRALKSLLAGFPILDLKDMMKEMDSIKCNYKVGGDIPDPHIMSMKMG